MNFLRKHWGKLLLVLFALWFFDFFDVVEERLGIASSRMNNVQQYCHLAPYPKSIRNIRFEKLSGMMSWGDRVYFTAPPDEVDAWLKASPSIATAESTQETSPMPMTRYSLRPGFLEVTTDKKQVGIVIGQALDGPLVRTPLFYLRPSN